MDPSRCEYCGQNLNLAKPENLALFDHFDESLPCEDAFNDHLSMINGQWLASCSGAA